MPATFAIQSVTIPLIQANYFTDPLSAFGAISSQTLLSRIVDLGATDVRLIVSLGQLDSPTGNTYSPSTPQSLESLKTFTDPARAAGLTITWDPFTNIRDLISGDPDGSGTLRPSNPDLWFQNFRAGMLEQARMAQAVGATRFVIVNDVEQPVFESHPELTGRLLTLVSEIRQVFSGQITTLLYTPNGQISRFPEVVLEAVDLVGLGLFATLTRSTNPTLAELKAALHSDINGDDIIGNLARLAASTGKPLWLADFAHSSYDGWLANPGSKFDPNATFVADNSEQVLGYQAFFSELLKFGQPWFQGFSIQSIGRIDDARGNTAAYLQSPIGENFFGKPGQQVITDYFTGNVAFEHIEVRGSNYGETVQGGYAFNTLRPSAASASVAGGALDDVIYGANPARGVAAHELKLVVTGNPTGGVAPTFEVRINGQNVPMSFTAGPQSTTLTVPIHMSGAITKVEVVTTNWTFGPDANRFVRFQSATLDGVDLKGLPTTYRVESGGMGMFTGDTNRGGTVTFDAAGATFTAPLRVDLAANHTIDGGPGRDVLIYDGASSQYLLGKTAAGLTTVQKPGALANEGLDTLSNVEVLRFTDKAVWIGSSFSLADTTVAQQVDLRFNANSQVTVGGQTVAVSNVSANDANTGAGADSIVGSPLDNRVFAGAGNDTITSGGAGSAAGDYLRGEAGDDSIIGGAGFDDAHGNMGNDTVSTGAGTDYTVGGQGGDLLSGGDDYDLVYGNLGDDTANGDAGDDIVRGGQGADLIFGGAGNDYVSGDRGDDTMTGGAGADDFHSFAEAGVDRVLDFNALEGDRVRLDFGTTFTVAQVGGDTVIQMSAGQVILVGVPSSAVPAGAIFVG